MLYEVITTDYAHSKSIILKGDIPIGVNRNSVDTWANSAYFCMDMQAGAPPDMFAVKGQNWELPTYNWEAIKQSGFEWWKKRFAQIVITSYSIHYTKLYDMCRQELKTQELAIFRMKKYFQQIWDTHSHILV